MLFDRSPFYRLALLLCLLATCAALGAIAWLLWDARASRMASQAIRAELARAQLEEIQRIQNLRELARQSNITECKEKLQDWADSTAELRRRDIPIVIGVLEDMRADEDRCASLGVYLPPPHEQTGDKQ